MQASSYSGSSVVPASSCRFSVASTSGGSSPRRRFASATKSGNEAAVSVSTSERSPARIVRAAPVADLVVEDDRAVISEIDEREQVVVGRARATVERDQRRGSIGV